MPSFISAGVYTLERDLSAYVSDLSATIVGMVGTSEKGPTNTPVLITSQKEFSDIFGAISPKHYLGYAALSYLTKGSSLWVTRVASSDSQKAKCTFILPESYTPYAGDWVLESQSTSELTLSVTDSALATGISKTIALSDDTAIPGFDFTDSTNSDNSNGKIGSDLVSFLTTSQQNLVLGNSFAVTLGPGKGTTSTVTGLLAGSSTSPKLKVSLSSFSSNNSPATATAVGSISMASTAVPSPSAPILVLGLSANDTNIKLVYHDTGDVLALTTSLSSSVEATKLTALESLLTVTSGSVYDVAFPMLDPTVSGNPALNLTFMKALLNAMLYVVNMPLSPSAVSYPKCAAVFTDLKVSTSGYAIKGIGSVSTSGASRGFRAVSSIADSTGAIIELRLDSLVTGVNGTFKYSEQTPTPVSPLIVKDQVVSGQFTLGMFRPTWVMNQSGTTYVPTVLKFSTLGETDASNLAITLAFDSDNVSAAGQSYTVRLYERLSASTISTSSVRLSDFSLIEQFDGTIDVIQSKIASSSRRLSMKIDYTTVDSLNYTTGVVTPGAESDKLQPSFVLLTSETGQGASVGLDYTLNSTTFDKIVTNFLSGGSSGSSITKSDIIGDPTQGTGIYSFSNPEVLDVNLLVAPGWSADPSVAKTLTSVCANRGDAFAILDCPFGLTVQEVVAFRKNISNINSSYSAMYYPWVKITDSVNNKDIFVPPSTLVAGQYAYNDQVADVYYAPAGLTRGSLGDAIATERLLTLGDRDTLSLNQVNPIHNESGSGIYIKGQFTMQSTTTALDRVNVRRLLLKLRKVVASASKSFEFELNDSTTAYRLKQIAETILEDHLRKGAVQSYTVDVGPNVNTSLTKENNELCMNISLVPTKSAEKIIETFTILPQSGGISIA